MKANGNELLHIQRGLLILHGDISDQWHECDMNVSVIHKYKSGLKA